LAAFWVESWADADSGKAETADTRSANTKIVAKRIVFAIMLLSR
jgi:hypothetical protein